MAKVIFSWVVVFWSVTLLGGYNEGSMEVWGQDGDLAVRTVDVSMQKESMPMKVSVAMIRFFQNHISPIDGPRSSYVPSSSQYTLQAIQKYGVLKGIAMGCDRLMRENKGEWIYPMTTCEAGTRKSDPVR